MSVARFFKFNPSQSKGFKSIMVPDGDILPLDFFSNSKEVYRDETMVICHVLLSDTTLNTMREMAEVDDPLSIEAVQALGIQGSYAGYEYNDKPMIGLFWFYPDLAGTKVVGVDEDGQDIIVNKVVRHRWLEG